MGVIKGMVVNLAQLPMKSVIMDVVVEDIILNLGYFSLGLGKRKLVELYKWI